jgi:predicted nucleic acid-binding protein
MGTALRIYLDACAVSRLTDDPGEMRVRMETGAVRHIFRLIEDRRAQWIASSVLETEVKENPNLRKRLESLEMLNFAAETIFPDDRIETRAHFLHSVGYGRFDALHLSLAEASNVDALVTTDDRFLRQAHRGLGKPLVKIANPVDWIKRVRP